MIGNKPTMEPGRYREEQEQTPERVITVADIDPLMPIYHVFTEAGREIGSKSKEFGYLKPRYGKHWKRRFGERASFEDRSYKTTPPWFKLRVVEITDELKIIVEEKE